MALKKTFQKTQNARDGIPQGRRGQAAIFDGITLLLLASLSSALIFSFLGSYGVQEERVIRSAYVLNYMQSVMKTFYYLDASTLQSVSDRETDSNGRVYQLPIYADLAKGPTACNRLSTYLGSVTVSDLMKRDLGEKADVLDDSFEGSPIMGISAVRCAFKELIKPFAFSGYYYGLDVLRENQQNVQLGDPKKAVTNYGAFTTRLSLTGLCVDAQQVGSDVLTVSVPSRLVFIDPDAPPEDRQQVRRYEVRLCIWRPKV